MKVWDAVGGAGTWFRASNDMFPNQQSEGYKMIWLKWVCGQVGARVWVGRVQDVVQWCEMFCKLMTSWKRASKFSDRHLSYISLFVSKRAFWRYHLLWEFVVERGRSATKTLSKGSSLISRKVRWCSHVMVRSSGSTQGADYVVLQCYLTI